MTSPFFIGITGHRDLRPEDLPALREAVRAEIRAQTSQHPEQRGCLLSSLAAGADTLAASIASEEGLALWAVLPMPRDQYALDFSIEELALLDGLLMSAQKTTVLETLADPRDPAQRVEAYARAGAYVAERCDWLLALWDGEENLQRGGTADVVRYRLQGAPPELRPNASQAPRAGALCHISTPRQSASGGGHVEPAGRAHVLWPPHLGNVHEEETAST